MQCSGSVHKQTTLSDLIDFFVHSALTILSSNNYKQNSLLLRTNILIVLNKTVNEVNEGCTSDCGSGVWLQLQPINQRYTPLRIPPITTPVALESCVLSCPVQSAHARISPARPCPAGVTPDSGIGHSLTGTGTGTGAERGRTGQRGA